MIFKEIPIGKIFVKKNIRTDPDGELGGLMETIEKYDMLQPILVIPKNGSYELVSGHRRLKAMKARNEATIPCVIRDDFSGKSIPFIKLIENIQRKQLSSHELVEIFEEMKKITPGLINSAIAKMIGKTDGWIHLKYKAAKIYIELIEKGFPEEALDELCDADLMKLTRVKDKKERQEVAKKITEGGDRVSLVQEAESYIAPKKRGSYQNYSLEQDGFALMSSGEHNILILCKDERIKAEIDLVIINHYRRKHKERENRDLDSLETWDKHSEVAKQITLALNIEDLLQIPSFKRGWGRSQDKLDWTAEEIDKVLKNKTPGPEER